MNREKIVSRIGEIKAEEKRLKAELNELWDALEITGPQDPEVYGNYILKVTERSTFSADTANRNLPSDQLEKICISKPDSRLAKAHLDEDTYKILCCTQSLTRTVEPVKDDK